MWLTNLADVLRRGGCKVIENGGWQKRGHGAMVGVRGVVIHHTGGGGSGDWKTVQNGRPGLEGPLAHLTLERDGTFRVIAAGQCWHAGTGGPLAGAPRNAGNSYLIGIEGVCNGRDWTQAQREAYPRGAAALAKAYGFSASSIVGHKEWAPNRKVDPGNWDMNAFRGTAQNILKSGTSPSTPAPAPARSPEVSIENYTPLVGRGVFILKCPVDDGTFTADAYLSAVCDGGEGSVHVYVQDERGGGVEDFWFTADQLRNTPQNGSPTAVHRLVKNTHTMKITYDFSKSTSGCITLEAKSR